MIGPTPHTFRFKMAHQSLFQNVQFCSRSRKTKILATEIYRIFRGLKFEYDPRGIGFAFHRASAEIVQKWVF
jgi:hypothetical protein